MLEILLGMKPKRISFITCLKTSGKMVHQRSLGPSSRTWRYLERRKGTRGSGSYLLLGFSVWVQREEAWFSGSMSMFWQHLKNCPPFLINGLNSSLLPSLLPSPLFPSLPPFSPHPGISISPFESQIPHLKPGRIIHRVLRRAKWDNTHSLNQPYLP